MIKTKQVRADLVKPGTILYGYRQVVEVFESNPPTALFVSYTIIPGGKLFRAFLAYEDSDLVLIHA